MKRCAIVLKNSGLASQPCEYTSYTPTASVANNTYFQKCFIVVTLVGIEPDMMRVKISYPNH